MKKMNPVVHFEMPAEDRKRMVAFYEKTFGWKATMLGADMMDYTLVQTTETNKKGKVKAPGAINGGFYPRKADWPAQYPAVVIAVPNIRGAMKRIVKQGGKVLGEPILIPGYGKYVSFMDTEGNRSSIMEMI